MKLQLHQIIQIIRKRKGYSQEYVAENAKISISTYRRIENGENVGSHYLQQVINCLDIQIVALCFS